MPSKKKEKYFWSYKSVMDDLSISRRTLQRWLDDLNIDSLEFEDHLKVFLKLPDVQALRDYSRVMRTRSQNLIETYRNAFSAGNERRMARILKDADAYQYEKTVNRVQ